MPGKSSVGLQLKLAASGEAIPWEYVRTAWLRTVLENDGRIDAMDPPDVLYFFASGPARAWLSDFSS